MAWISRLFAFPGGLLEVRATTGSTADDPGLYLEFDGYDEQDGEEMLYRPTCLGYLRIDVSGVAQLWDEAEVRRMASRLGYDFAGMVLFDPLSGRPPLARLKAQATRLHAEAVIMPGLEHFEAGSVPESLVRRIDVITVHPEETYARPGAVGLGGLRSSWASTTSFDLREGP